MEKIREEKERHAAAISGLFYRTKFASVQSWRICIKIKKHAFSCLILFGGISCIILGFLFDDC
jgi:hypothetical protein